MPKKNVQVKKKRPIPQKNSKGGAGAYSLVFFGLGIVVVIGVVIGYMLLSKPYTPNVLSASQIKNLVNASTVTIPDMDIQVPLQSGNGTFEIDGASGAVSVSEPYFSVKTNSGYDVYAVMVVNTGGSGEFVNVALFTNKDGKIDYAGAYPVGDRVKITEISGPVVSKSGEYTLTVNYLDRSADAPMADAPTIPKSVNLSVINSKFVSN